MNFGSASTISEKTSIHSSPKSSFF